MDSVEKSYPICRGMQERKPIGILSHIDNAYGYIINELVKEKTIDKVELYLKLIDRTVRGNLITELGYSIEECNKIMDKIGEDYVEYGKYANKYKNWEEIIMDKTLKIKQEIANRIEEGEKKNKIINSIAKQFDVPNAEIKVLFQEVKEELDQDRKEEEVAQAVDYILSEPVPVAESPKFKILEKTIYLKGEFDRYKISIQNGVKTVERDYDSTSFSDKGSINRYFNEEIERLQMEREELLQAFDY